MRGLRIFPLFAILVAGLAFADDQFTGRLVDANCSKGDGRADACDPGTSTTNFGLVLVSGEAYLFDSKGNQKASEAMKRRAALSDSNHKLPSAVTATVDGKPAGKTILVRQIVID